MIEIALLVVTIGLIAYLGSLITKHSKPPLMGNDALPWFHLANEMAECLSQILVWDKDIATSLNEANREQATALVKRFKSQLGGNHEPS